MKRSNPYVSTTRDYKKSRFEPVSAMYARRATAPNRYVRQTNSVAKTGLQKIIKKTVIAMAEAKKIQFSQTANVFGYNAAAQGFCSFQLTPVNAGSLNIVQGTGEADRIGDKVRVKKVTLSYVLQAGPLDASFNTVPAPQDVRMIVCYNKQSKVLSPPAGNFFDAGDSSAAPTSNMLDMVNFVNSEYIQVHGDWRHKVGVQTFPHPNTKDNNDYKLNAMKTIDITKWYPKTLTWNDTSGVIMEQSKWLQILVAPADGSAVDTVGLTTFKPLLISYAINLEFTDF